MTLRWIIETEEVLKGFCIISLLLVFLVLYRGRINYPQKRKLMQMLHI